MFGAVWIEARVATDRDTLTVECLDVKVPEVKFPNANPEQLAMLTTTLEDAVQSWNVTISLDDLLSSLDLVKKAREAAEDLENTTPQVLFVDHPARLLTFDGESKLAKVKNTDLMRAINTPFFVVLDGSSQSYFMMSGNA